MNQMQDVVRRGKERGREGEASVSDFYGNILPNAAAATIAPFLISAGRPVGAVCRDNTTISILKFERGRRERERERETRRKKKRDVRRSLSPYKGEFISLRT